jgi:hypothetical protein
LETFALEHRNEWLLGEWDGPRHTWPLTWLLNTNCWVSLLVTPASFRVITHDGKVTVMGKNVQGLMAQAGDYFQRAYGVLR